MAAVNDVTESFINALDAFQLNVVSALATRETSCHVALFP